MLVSLDRWKYIIFFVTFVARFVRSEQLFVVSADQSALAQVDKFLENTVYYEVYRIAP